MHLSYLLEQIKLFMRTAVLAGGGGSVAGDEAEFSGDPKSAVAEEGYLLVGLSFLGTSFAVFF